MGRPRHGTVISGRRTIEGETGGNLVLVASDTAIDQTAVEAAIATWVDPADTVVLAEAAVVEAFIGESVVLTDDFAPVDQLLGR